MSIIGLPFEGPSRRLARSGPISEEHAAGRRGRRADNSAPCVRQWRTLSCSRRCYCCKTKTTDITKSGARRGIYCTMVLPIPWYLFSHHARRTNWLAVRSFGPNGREAADIGGFPAPSMDFLSFAGREFGDRPRIVILFCSTAMSFRKSRSLSPRDEPLGSRLKSDLPDDDGGHLPRLRRSLKQADRSDLGRVASL